MCVHACYCCEEGRPLIMELHQKQLCVLDGQGVSIADRIDTPPDKRRWAEFRGPENVLWNQSTRVRSNPAGFRVMK